MQNTQPHKPQNYKIFYMKFKKKRFTAKDKGIQPLFFGVLLNALLFPLFSLLCGAAEGKAEVRGEVVGAGTGASSPSVLTAKAVAATITTPAAMIQPIHFRLFSMIHAS